MFSGFKTVMENLAQPQPRPGHSTRSESQELSTGSEKLDGQHSRGSASFDLSSVANSTGYLAESAFSNLRKSLATQRPFTVVSPPSESSRARSSSPQSGRELKPVSKPALEDRLRASFAIGDVSGSTSPNPSHAPSPRPQQPATSNGILSPSSMPLPDSPLTSPPPIDLTSPQPRRPDLPHTLSNDHPLSDESTDSMPVKNEPVTNAKDRGFRIAISPTRARYPEADVPLPLMSPISANPNASQSSISSRHSTSLSLDCPLQVNGDTDEANALRARLQSLENQLNDVSSSLKKLTATQDAVNAVLAELTPISDISDIEGLKSHLRTVNSERNSSHEEIKRLNGKLSIYDERIEELRDTHRLESRSQTELVDNLRKQLEESEALLKAAQGSTSQAEEDARLRQAEIEQIRSEAQKLKETVKEEEEKRVKAISLLKTVRQKLVKAEKDRDEAVKEVSALKEKEKDALERATLEKAQLEKEIENVKAEKEATIAGLKNHFDRELIGMKEKLEKEFSARKGQLELEASSTKASFQKEIANKASRIQTLENEVRTLNSERDSLFDQLQLRQAELESSQSMLESLQSSTAELQFQLKEVTDRNSLLAEQLADAQRELEYRSQRPSLSAEGDARNRAASETKYESKISELTSRLAEIERDRNDIETTLTRNIQQKTQEIELLRKLVDASADKKGASEDELLGLRKEVETLHREIATYQEQLSDLDRQKDVVNELEAQLQRQNVDFASRMEQHEREVAEAKERERQVRAANKTLREELRKVQNSAALLERQRNPGVGYWSNIARHDNSSDVAISSSSPSTPNAASTSRVNSPAPSSNEEEVNLEYIRNIILQFLEHKDMRPHLVRVLSVILRFTPQETRRLMAKV